MDHYGPIYVALVRAGWLSHDEGMAALRSACLDGCPASFETPAGMTILRRAD